MTRETKFGLLVGLGVILLIGIVVSDHLSVANRDTFTDFSPGAADVIVQDDDLIDDPAGTTSADSNATANTTTSLGGRVTTNNPAPENPIPQPHEMTETPSAGQTPASNDRAMPGLAASRTNVDPPTDNGVGARSVMQSNQNVGQPTRSARSGQIYTVEANPTRKQYQEHIVKSGETLYEITQRFYGDGNKWRVIAKANPRRVGKNGLIRPGITLRIPQLEQETSAPQQHADPATDPPQPRVLPTDPQPQRQRGWTIETTTGDTLSQLAKVHLGSWRNWRTLLQANRDQLAKPEDLRAGMVLRLPGSTDATVHERVPAADAPQPRDSEAPDKQYVVKPNDSLITIARRMLGSGDRWHVLYQVNRDLLNDPHSITPGQTLTLPQ